MGSSLEFRGNLIAFVEEFRLLGVTIIARRYRLKITCVLLGRKLTTRAALSEDVEPCFRLILD